LKLLVHAFQLCADLANAGAIEGGRWSRGSRVRVVTQGSCRRAATREQL